MDAPAHPAPRPPRLPAAFAPWAAHVVERLAIRSATTSCLDLPCADGVLATALARAAGPSGRVLAVDSDPGAVAACARRIATLGLRTVAAHPAGPGAPAPADRFDAAGSLLTLPHRPDRAVLLGRAWHALAPGGHLAAAVWAQPADVPPIHHVAAAFAAVTGATPAALHEATSLGTDAALAALAREAGLPDGRVDRVCDVVRFDGALDLLTTVSAAYCLAGDLAALDDARVTAMVDVLTDALRPCARADGTLVMPAEARLLVVGPAPRPALAG